MEQYGLNGDLCDHSESGQPVPRIDMSILEKIGTRIKNGETVRMKVENTAHSVFAITMDGTLSNEVILDDSSIKHLTLTTKGGFASISYPVFEQ